jgi:AcrR family transcriptional regulator
MPTRPRRREASREQELLEAARRLFSQKGFANTTVSDIVREAGVAQGTFYLYFHSKAALVQRLLKMFDDLVQDEVAASGDDSLSRAERIRTQVKAAFHASAKHADLVRMLFLDASIGVAELIQTARPTTEQRMQAAAEVLRAGIASGEFHEMDSTLAARLVFAMVRGAVVEWVLHGSDTDPEEFAEGLAQILIRGLVKTPRAVALQQRSKV